MLLYIIASITASPVVSNAPKAAHWEPGRLMDVNVSRIGQLTSIVPSSLHPHCQTPRSISPSSEMETSFCKTKK